MCEQKLCEQDSRTSCIRTPSCSSHLKLQGFTVGLVVAVAKTNTKGVTEIVLVGTHTFERNMSTKSKGPLHQLQYEGDSLKKEVDNVESQVKELIEEDAIDTTEINKAYHSCIQMKIKSSSMLLNAHQLQQTSETSRVQNFDSKKKEEIQRFQLLQKRLNDLMDLIEANCDNAEDLRTLRSSQEVKEIQMNGGDHEEENVTDAHNEQEEDEDGEYTDEEEEEDDEYEDEEEDNYYEVVHKFAGEQEGDLSVEVGDVVSVVHMQEDGWWEVKDDDGKIGMVPSNYLQEYEEEDEEESTLQEDTGERAAEHASPRSGKDLWKGIKDAVNEPVKTDVTDVLSALGAIPAGFRPSTLCKLVATREEYTLRNAILPSFTESNIGLQDLQWDPTLNQIRALPTRVLRSCRLWSCKMIPLAGSGVEILSRHIRLSLFDGANIVSNIHTVRANCNANSQKLWTFSPRVSGILPSLLDGTCTVRSNITHSNLGILFELGITYIRTPPKKILHFSDGTEAIYSGSQESLGEEGAREKLIKTGERAELSCGWVFLKLFDEQGMAIPNRTYELPVNGGTPYEKGVEVDPSISRRASTNRFRNLLSANKQPKLVIKMGTPNNAKKKFMNLLPVNIVLPSTYCELVSYYRRVLADALIRDRLSPRDADPISCPILSSFPKVIMLSDVMDAVRSSWADKVKTLRRGDKRDKENMKTKFREVFLESGYVLLHSTTLPPPLWAHPQIEEERWQKIFHQLQLNKPSLVVPTPTETGTKPTQMSGVLKTLLAPNVDYEPFDMEEINFNLLQDYRRSMPATV